MASFARSAKIKCQDVEFNVDSWVSPASPTVAILLERHHNDRFVALMDSFMPQWRQYREILSKAPLGHKDWGY